MSLPHVFDGPCWCSRSRAAVRHEREYKCPEPGCPMTDRDPEAVLQHAFRAHGKDRRDSRVA